MHRIAVPGLLLVVALMGMACSVSLDEAEEADILIADRPIEVEVSAFRMVQDYESNRLAANQKYDGNVLSIRGIVTLVSGGTDGTAYYVDLDGQVFQDVRCYFSEDRLDELLGISVGDRVTLKGLGAEKEDRHPATVDVIGCSVMATEQGAGPAIERYEALVREATSSMNTADHWAQRHVTGRAEYLPVIEEHQGLMERAGELGGEVQISLPDYRTAHEAYEQLVQETDQLFQEYTRTVERRDRLSGDEEYAEAIKLAEAAVEMAGRLNDNYHKLQVDVGNLAWKLGVINGYLVEDAAEADAQADDAPSRPRPTPMPTPTTRSTPTPLPTPTATDDEADNDDAEKVAAIEQYEGLVSKASNLMQSADHWAARHVTGRAEYLPVIEEHQGLMEQTEELSARVEIRLPDYNNGHEAYEQLVQLTDQRSQEYQQAVEQRDSLFGEEKYAEAIKLAEATVELATRLNDNYWQLQFSIGDLAWQLGIINGYLAEDADG